MYWVDKKVMEHFSIIFCKVAAIVLNFDFIYDISIHEV
jgi:hypothetical protein